MWGQKLGLTRKHSPVKYSCNYFGSLNEFFQVSSLGHWFQLYKPRGQTSHLAEKDQLLKCVGIKTKC